MTEEIYAAEQGTQEISEPETEAIEEVNDVEEPEVTEQASELPEGKSKQDAAFAQMRREKEDALARTQELENRIAEMEARESARKEGIAKALGEEDDFDLDSFIAESAGYSVDELNELIATVENEAAEKKEEEARLQKIIDERDQLSEIVHNIWAKEDISIIKDKFGEQAAEINTKDDLARTCGKFMDNGLSQVEAFEAYLRVKARTEQKPPKEIGQVGQTPDENGYLTREQVEAMTDEEQERNYELIIKSQQRW